MKRRWSGWTAKELKHHLGEQDHAKDRELFLKWRDDDINYIRENGYNSPNSRVGDKNDLEEGAQGEVQLDGPCCV